MGGGAISAKLEGRLASVTLEEVRKLLRVVNSYYSNLIEGHRTHPIDIKRAMCRTTPPIRSSVTSRLRA